MAAAHARISARQEEGNRISGEIFAPVRGYDDNSLDRLFAHSVQMGCMHMLENGGPLVDTDFPQGLPLTCKAWADVWLPNARVEAKTLAQQVGATDVIDIVQRILVPFTEDAVPVASPAGSPFASLSSDSAGQLSSRSEPNPVSELYFVMLVGSEVRLAIYALLKPFGRKSGRPRRLRLLSGDVRAGKESSFVYTVRSVAEDQPRPSAADFAREELDALRTALMTGEWGFVTLL